MLLVQLEVDCSLQKGSAQHDMLTGYIPAARLPATIDACARDMAEGAGTCLYNTKDMIGTHSFTTSSSVPSCAKAHLLR